MGKHDEDISPGKYMLHLMRKINASQEDIEKLIKYMPDIAELLEQEKRKSNL